MRENDRWITDPGRQLKILVFCALFSLALAACSSTPGIIYEAPGRYGSIVVEENAAGMRTLMFERNGARQSVVKMGDPDHLELSYARTVLAGLALSGKSRRMLVLGLGGGSLPMFLHKNYPEAIIDVAEIDPDVVAIAKRFFDVREDARLRIHLGDARSFVEASDPGSYDLILVDAYGANSAPAHLTTQEFLRALRRAVSPQGVVIGNLWRRPFNASYDSMVLTYQSVFEQNMNLDVPGDVNSILLAVPRTDPIVVEDLARAAGAVARERRFRVDLEGLVRKSFVSSAALKLDGKILRDEDIKVLPKLQ
jgi:spermidine synthase